MSYIAKKDRLFKAGRKKYVVHTRSEARLKRYISTDDLRAWCYDVDDRRRHIIEYMARNRNGICPGSIIPMEKLLDAILACRGQTRRKPTSTSQTMEELERKIAEMQRLLDAYTQLELTPEQEEQLNQMLGKDVNQLYNVKSHGKKPNQLSAKPETMTTKDKETSNTNLPQTDDIPQKKSEESQTIKTLAQAGKDPLLNKYGKKVSKKESKSESNTAYQSLGKEKGSVSESDMLAQSAPTSKKKSKKGAIVDYSDSAESQVSKKDDCAKLCEEGFAAIRRDLSELRALAAKRHKKYVPPTGSDRHSSEQEIAETEYFDESKQLKDAKVGKDAKISKTTSKPSDNQSKSPSNIKSAPSDQKPIAGNGSKMGEIIKQIHSRQSSLAAGSGGIVTVPTKTSSPIVPGGYSQQITIPKESITSSNIPDTTPTEDTDKTGTELDTTEQSPFEDTPKESSGKSTSKSSKEPLSKTDSAADKESQQKVSEAIQEPSTEKRSSLENQRTSIEKKDTETQKDVKHFDDLGVEKELRFDDLTNSDQKDSKSSTSGQTASEPVKDLTDKTETSSYDPNSKQKDDEPLKRTSTDKGIPSDEPKQKTSKSSKASFDETEKPKYDKKDIEPKDSFEKPTLSDEQRNPKDNAEESLKAPCMAKKSSCRERRKKSKERDGASSKSSDKETNIRSDNKKMLGQKDKGSDKGIQISRDEKEKSVEKKCASRGDKPCKRLNKDGHSTSTNEKSKEREKPKKYMDSTDEDENTPQKRKKKRECTARCSRSRNLKKDQDEDSSSSPCKSKSRCADRKQKYKNQKEGPSTSQQKSSEQKTNIEPERKQEEDKDQEEGPSTTQQKTSEEKLNIQQEMKKYSVKTETTDKMVPEEPERKYENVQDEKEVLSASVQMTNKMVQEEPEKKEEEDKDQKKDRFISQDKTSEQISNIEQEIKKHSVEIQMTNKMIQQEPEVVTESTDYRSDMEEGKSEKTTDYSSDWGVTSGAEESKVDEVTDYRSDKEGQVYSKMIDNPVPEEKEVQKPHFVDEVTDHRSDKDAQAHEELIDNAVINIYISSAVGTSTGSEEYQDPCKKCSEVCEERWARVESGREHLQKQIDAQREIIEKLQNQAKIFDHSSTVSEAAKPDMTYRMESKNTTEFDTAEETSKNISDISSRKESASSFVDSVVEDIVKSSTEIVQTGDEQKETEYKYLMQIEMKDPKSKDSVPEAVKNVFEDTPSYIYIPENEAKSEKVGVFTSDKNLQTVDIADENYNYVMQMNLGPTPQFETREVSASIHETKEATESCCEAPMPHECVTQSVDDIVQESEQQAEEAQTQDKQMQYPANAESVGILKTTKESESSKAGYKRKTKSVDKVSVEVQEIFVAKNVDMQTTDEEKDRPFIEHVSFAHGPPVIIHEHGRRGTHEGQTTSAHTAKTSSETPAKKSDFASDNIKEIFLSDQLHEQSQQFGGFLRSILDVEENKQTQTVKTVEEPKSDKEVQAMSTSETPTSDVTSIASDNEENVARKKEKNIKKKEKEKEKLQREKKYQKYYKKSGDKKKPKPKDAGSSPRLPAPIPIPKLDQSTLVSSLCFTEASAKLCQCKDTVTKEKTVYITPKVTDNSKVYVTTNLPPTLLVSPPPTKCNQCVECSFEKLDKSQKKEAPSDHRQDHEDYNEIVKERDVLRRKLEQALFELSSVKSGVILPFATAMGQGQMQTPLPAACESEIKVIEEELQMLKDNKPSKTEIDIIRKELDILKCYCSRVGAIESENQELKTDLQQLKSQSGELLDELGFACDGEANMDKLKYKLSQLNETIYERDQLRTRVDQLEKELYAYNDLPEDILMFKKRSVLLDEVLEDRDRLSKRCEMLRCVEEELKQMKKKASRVDELERALKKQKDINSYSEKEIESLRCQCYEAESELQSYKCEEASLRSQLSCMEHEVESMKCLCKESEIIKYERDSIRRSLDDLYCMQDEFEHMKNEVKALNVIKTERDMYKEKYEALLGLESECNHLRSQLDKAQLIEEERDELEKQVENLEMCICDQEKEIKQLVNHVEELAEGRDEQQAKMKTVLTNLRAELAAKEQIIEECEEKLALVQTELKHSIYGVASETKGLKNVNDRLEGQVKGLECECSKLRKELAQKQDVINMLSQEIHNVKAQTKSLHVVKQQLESSKEHLQNSMSGVVDEHSQEVLKQTNCALQCIIQKLNQQYQEWDAYKEKMNYSKQCTCDQNRSGNSSGFRECFCVDSDSQRRGRSTNDTINDDLFEDDEQECTCYGPDDEIYDDWKNWDCKQSQKSVTWDCMKTRQNCNQLMTENAHLRNILTKFQNHCPNEYTLVMQSEELPAGAYVVPESVCADIQIKCDELLMENSNLKNLLEEYKTQIVGGQEYQNLQCKCEQLMADNQAMQLALQQIQQSPQSGTADAIIPEDQMKDNSHMVPEEVCAELQERCNQLLAENANLQKALAQIQNSHLEGLCEQLKQENEDLRNMSMKIKNEAQQEINSLTYDLNATLQQNEEFRREYQQLQTQMEQALKRPDFADKQTFSLGNVNEELSIKCKTLKDKLKELKATCITKETYDCCKERLDKATEENAKLRQELDTLRSEKAEVEKLIDTNVTVTTRRTSKLEDELNRLRKEKEAWEAERCACGEKVKDYVNQLKQLKEENEKMRIQLANVQDKCNKEKCALKKQVASQKKEIANLVDIVKPKEIEVKDVKQDKSDQDALKAALTSLEDQLKSVKSSEVPPVQPSKDFSSSIEALKKQLQEALDKGNKAEEKLKELKANDPSIMMKDQIDQLTSKLAQGDVVIDRLKVALAACEDEKLDLKKQIDNARNEAIKLQDELSKLKNSLKNATDENQRLKDDLANVKGDATAALMSSERQRMSEENDKLKTDLDAADRNIKSYLKKIENIENENGILKEDLANKDNENQRLKKELDNANKDAINFNKRLAEMQADNKGLKEKIDDLENEISRLKKELDDVLKDAKKGGQDVKSLQNELAELKMKNAELESLNTKTKRESETRAKEAESAKSDLNTAKEENGRLKVKISDLEKELDKLRKDYESVQKGADKGSALQDELNKLKTELKSLEENNSKLREDLDSALNKEKACQGQLSKIQENEGNLKKKLADLENENSKLKSEVEKAAGDGKASKLDLEKLKASENELKAKLKQMEDINKELKENLDQSKKDSQGLNENYLADNKKKQSLLENENENLKKKIDEAQSKITELGQLKDVNAKQQQVIANLEAEIAQLKQRLDKEKGPEDIKEARQAEKIASLQDEIDKLKKAADSEKDEKNKLNDELAKQKSLISNLEEEIANLKQQLAKGDGGDRIKELEAELEKTKKECDNNLAQLKEQYNRDLNNLKRKSGGSVDRVQKDSETKIKNMKDDYENQINALKNELKKANQVAAKNAEALKRASASSKSGTPVVDLGPEEKMKGDVGKGKKKIPIEEKKEDVRKVKSKEKITFETVSIPSQLPDVIALIPPISKGELKTYEKLCACGKSIEDILEKIINFGMNAINIDELQILHTHISMATTKLLEKKSPTMGRQDVDTLSSVRRMAILESDILRKQKEATEKLTHLKQAVQLEKEKLQMIKSNIVTFEKPRMLTPACIVPEKDKPQKLCNSDDVKKLQEDLKREQLKADQLKNILKSYSHSSKPTPDLEGSKPKTEKNLRSEQVIRKRLEDKLRSKESAKEEKSFRTKGRR